MVECSEINLALAAAQHGIQGMHKKGECLSRPLLMPAAHCALQTPNLNMTRAGTPISLMRMLLDSSVQDTQSDTIFVAPCHCNTAPTDFNICHTFCFLTSKTIYLECQCTILLDVFMVKGLDQAN